MGSGLGVGKEIRHQPMPHLSTPIIAPPQVGSTRLLASLNSCLYDPICVLGPGMRYFYFITSRACHLPFLCLNPSKLFGVNQGQEGGATSGFANHPAVCLMNSFNLFWVLVSSDELMEDKCILKKEHMIFLQSDSRSPTFWRFSAPM